VVSFNGDFIESFIALNIINFVDMPRREKYRVSWNEKSFITIKFICHSYLVLSLDNRVYEVSTETDLKITKV